MFSGSLLSVSVSSSVSPGCFVSPRNLVAPVFSFVPQDGNSRVVVHGGSQRVGLHPPGLLVETLPFGNDGQASVDFPSSVRIVKVEGHFMRCRVASASVAQAVGIGCLVAFRQGVQGFIVRTVEKGTGRRYCGRCFGFPV